MNKNKKQKITKPKKEKTKQKTLLELRESTGLTRVEVAAECFIHEMTLFNYEKFYSEPCISAAILLAKFYGVHVEDIKWS